MKAVLRKKSLFRQLLLFFVSLSLLPIIVYSLFASYKLSDTIQKDNEKYENLACMHIVQSIDNWMKTCEQDAFQYVNQDTVQAYLRSRVDNTELYSDYRLSMTRIWAGNPDLADVAFYTRKGSIDSIHLSGSSFNQSSGKPSASAVNSSSLNALMEKDTANVQWFSGPIFDIAHDPISKSAFDNTFALCRKVIDINTGDPLGVLVWHYRIDSIEERYRDTISDHNCVILVDQAGKIINPNGMFSSVADLDDSVFSELNSGSGYFITSLNSEKYFLSYSRSKTTGWTVVSYTPWDYIMQPLAQTRLMLIQLLLMLVLIVIAVSLIYATIIVRPIKSLTKAMESIDYDHLKPQEMTITEDEIGRLTRCFYDMCTRIDRLVRQNESNHKLMRDVELRALQSQINPHFLYNTLDNIIWIAKAHGEKEIEEMLISLSRFYRISLSNGMAEIPFSKELELLRYYLSLLVTRESHKNFTVDYDIAPETLDIPFPKIILQPIVENSIKHGFRGMEKPGHIIIRSRIEDQHMIVQVIDNGIGFQPREHNPSEQMLAITPGYGIANINARLTQLDSDTHALQYSSAPGGGVIVSIRIPIAKKENGGNHEIQSAAYR